MLEIMLKTNWKLEVNPKNALFELSNAHAELFSPLSILTAPNSTGRQFL
jgi:hypothetical protein